MWLVVGGLYGWRAAWTDCVVMSLEMDALVRAHHSSILYSNLHPRVEEATGLTHLNLYDP